MDNKLKTTLIALTIAGLGLTALDSAKLESDTKVLAPDAVTQDPRGVYVQYDENGEISSVVYSVREPAHLMQVRASKAPETDDKFDGQRFIKGSALEELLK